VRLTPALVVLVLLWSPGCNRDPFHSPVIGCDDGFPEDEAARENEVCLIRFSVVAAETLAAGLPQPDEPAFHEQCLREFDFAHHYWPAAGYQQLLDCMASAESTAAMEVCVGDRPWLD
jgi:hypothetical protein